MKHVLLVFILLFPFSSYLFSESVLKGRVTDLSGEPVSYATVYINGSTKGSRTDLAGYFEIGNPTFPCQLVMSHLGYETSLFSIKELPKNPISISVKEKVVHLSEVSVIGKSQKEQLIKEFKDAFLGTDTWGKAARLLNDSVLIFGLDYGQDSIQIKQAYRALTVKAKEPLQIDLPLLGYELSIDLVSFSSVYTKTIHIQNDSGEQVILPGISRCSYLGYYFVKPYETDQSFKLKKYIRNRRDAYYNSKEHFLKALYHNELKKNGFLLMEHSYNQQLSMNEIKPANIDSCFRYDGKGHMYVIGLKDRKFRIHYFCRFNGMPVDLTKKTLSHEMEYFDAYSVNYKPTNQSTILFLSDTCTIEKDGFIPDINIAFIGKNNQKKVGASLPDDFRPDE
jgi:hypothetical protein